MKYWVFSWYVMICVISQAGNRGYVRVPPHMSTVAPVLTINECFMRLPNDLQHIVVKYYDRGECAALKTQEVVKRHRTCTRAALLFNVFCIGVSCLQGIEGYRMISHLPEVVPEPVTHPAAIAGSACGLTASIGGLAVAVGKWSCNFDQLCCKNDGRGLEREVLISTVVASLIGGTTSLAVLIGAKDPVQMAVALQASGMLNAVAGVGACVKLRYIKGYLTRRLQELQQTLVKIWDTSQG